MSQSTKRVREIVSVLRKHNIKEGLTPEKLRLILEDLGPAFIKLGQIASMHPDILPRAYCEELLKLCSDVPPMPYDEVISIVEESCGCPWDKVFSWIQKTPEGSASIAQVHKARLRSGELAAVKVQRRGIYDIMSEDIRLLRRLVRFLPASVKKLADIGQMLDDIWTVTREEMDFVMEAANIKEFSRRNKEIAYIGVPKLYDKYTFTHMLVMEYIDGYAIDDQSALLAYGYDLREIAEKLASNYIAQVVDEGFFHADPHVGNIRIREGKIVWIDLGMMGRLSENDRQKLALGIQGIAMNDINMIEEAVLSLCEFNQRPDRKKLREGIETILEKYGQTGMGNIKLTDLFADLMEVMRENQIKMPHSLTMLVRGLTYMESILAELSPDISMVEIAWKKITENFLEAPHIADEFKKSGKEMLLSFRKAQDIPSSLSDVLREFRSGNARMGFDLYPTDQFSRLLYDLLQNLIEGMLAVALLIGSSIVCTSDLEPRVLGIPVLAAAGYGLAILLLFHSYIRRRKNK